jgi:hypothetical protein
VGKNFQTFLAPWNALRLPFPSVDCDDRLLIYPSWTDPQEITVTKTKGSVSDALERYLDARFAAEGTPLREVAGARAEAFEAATAFIDELVPFLASALASGLRRDAVWASELKAELKKK